MSYLLEKYHDVFHAKTRACISGLVVKSPLAMRRPRVRFPADAINFWFGEFIINIDRLFYVQAI